MSNQFNLKDKVILVTGASGDLGKSISNSFLNANAIVYGFDNQSNKIESNMYTHYICDLTDFEKFNKYCDNIYSKESKIDVLINNAGITIPSKNKGEYFFNDWEKTIRINLTTPFFLQSDN